MAKITQNQLNQILELEKKMRKRETNTRYKIKKDTGKIIAGAYVTESYEYRGNDAKRGDMTKSQADKYIKQLQEDLNAGVGLVDKKEMLPKELVPIAKEAREIQNAVNNIIESSNEDITQIKNSFDEFTESVSNNKETTPRTLSGASTIDILKSATTGLRQGYNGNAINSLANTLNILNKDKASDKEKGIYSLYNTKKVKNEETGEVEEVTLIDQFNEYQTNKNYYDNYKEGLKNEIESMDDGDELKGMYSNLLNDIENMDEEEFYVRYRLGLIPLTLREVYDELKEKLVENYEKNNKIYENFKNYYKNKYGEEPTANIKDKFNKFNDLSDKIKNSNIDIKRIKKYIR